MGKVPAAARAARLVGREEDAEHHDLDRHQRLQGQHEREAAHRPRVRPQARQPVRGQAAHQRVGHHERRACARSQGKGRVTVPYCRTARSLHAQCFTYPRGRLHATNGAPARGRQIVAPHVCLHARCLNLSSRQTARKRRRPALASERGVCRTCVRSA